MHIYIWIIFVLLMMDQLENTEVSIFEKIKSQQTERGYAGFSINKLEAYHFLDKLTQFLFPPTSIRHIELSDWETIEHTGHKLFSEALGYNGQAEFNIFKSKLPHILNLLYNDAENILSFDPAASSVEEVILTYPGFYAITVYRLCHEIYLLKIPLLSRLLSEYAHGRTGIDIHPGANIATPFFIDHGTGVVIGETCEIGPNVKIYQGVTLGALQVKRDLYATKRHPTIQENVVIYAGSTILGGNTVIGHNTIIGGNSWLTESVPPYSLVYQKSEVKVRPKEMPDVINFII